MATNKPFVSVPSRQTRLYANVSEDRMELLLDRFRASLRQNIDWVGVWSAVFATVASFVGLYESWRGTTVQIILLMATTVFGSVVAYRVFDFLKINRERHPMTNEEFLAALAEEMIVEEERRSAGIDKTSVSI